MTDSALKALAEIITTQTEALQAAYARAGAQVPSINAPFQPSPLEFDPNINNIRQLIVAAASQLIATVQSPIEIIQLHTGGMFETATLGFVVDVNVPDLLKEAGSKGLHVDDISAATGVDASYLSRILRFLATRHIFKEVSPNVFANNRNSSLLLKSKTLQEIKDDPIARFDNAPSAAFVHMLSAEPLEAMSCFPSYIKDPSQAATMFNLKFQTPLTLWEWSAQPGYEWRARRIAAVMNGTDAQYSAEEFVSAISSSSASLQENDIIVDVGGSTGSACLTLKKAFPQLRYVVQDLEQPIASAKKFWAENDPEAVESGRVKLEDFEFGLTMPSLSPFPLLSTVHSFFTPQPIKNASIYFLRNIIHDWSDSECKKILGHLREAAGLESKLVAFGTLARHTCEDSRLLENLAEDMSDSKIQKSPYPLLGNLGVGGEGFSTMMDMGTMLFLAGKERTRDEFEQLGKETGWKLESVRPGKLAAFIYSVV
ncbi:hypothetical protein D9758_004439 [Tetrapyrgos nigripes]|uniref:S-adenosyl-L-methionine-dependent methyltransferase n=1 Tax=Tetrapyrgos nigripes TaxID=182062 RepID=A0A8H5LSL7_9AGAR|nr:hypothetical protein D9758_004439 [Tetrapyrgos nigripes]